MDRFRKNNLTEIIFDRGINVKPSLDFYFHVDKTHLSFKRSVINSGISLKQILER